MTNSIPSDTIKDASEDLNTPKPYNVCPLRTLRSMARRTAKKEFKNIYTNKLLVFDLDVDKAISLTDPEKKRKAINAAAQKLQTELWSKHIPRYAQCRRIFRTWQKTGVDLSDRWSSPLLSLQLKESHIIWCFKNLQILKLLEQDIKQPDLFAF